MRLRALAALLPLSLLIGLVTSPVASAAVVSGLAGFRAIEVDEAHGHVFISQGNDALLVTDLNGTLVDTLSVSAGSGMALSDDGSTLYVAQRTADSIAFVDTTTLAVTTHATGSGTCPLDVAVTGGLIWFGYTCDDQWGNVGAMDPATGTVLASEAGAGLQYNPRLLADPLFPNTLIIGEVGISPQTTRVFDTAYTPGSDTPPALTLRKSEWDSGPSSDLAFFNDGARFINTARQIYKIADLAHDGTYPGFGRAGIDIDDSGRVAAGSEGGLDIFEPNSKTLLRHYDFGAAGWGWTLSQGVVWVAGKVFAVTQPDYGANPELHVMRPRKASSMTIKTDRAQYRYGAKAQVTVTLAAGTSNRAVAIYATPYGGARQLLTTVQVPVGASRTVSVAVARRTTLSASNSGDELYDASSAATTVKVAARVTPKVFNSKGRAGKFYLFGPKARAILGAQVSPNHAGQCLYFRLQFLVQNGPTVVTRCVKMTANSVAGAYVDGEPALIGVPFRMRAEWRGDTANVAAKSAWRYMKFTR